MQRGLCLLAAFVLVGCEDGPGQIFTPNQGDTELQNGYRPGAAYHQDGTKDFTFTAGQGDSVNRAQFCDESQAEKLVQQLVRQPITPDGSLGGIPLWTKEGQAVHANDLIGLPSDGKFCDPTIYSNALTWGPTNEIIAFIDSDTKLVQSVAATSQYLGTMEGSFPGVDGKAVNVRLELRERIRLGDRELTQYTSSADQADRPNAWLNAQNLSDVWRMLRHTYFGATELDPTFDCVANKVCDIIYTGTDETVPQDTVVVFQDSGVVLAFSPEGHVTWVEVEPVRVAPFETASNIQFTTPGNTVAPKFISASRPDCNLDISQNLTWGQFKSSCVDDTRTLTRATYGVHTMRDGVDVSFKGVTLSFQRDITKLPLMENGEQPNDADVLFSLNFTRTLNADVAEFVPQALAQSYKTLLEKRLKDLVNDPAHPLSSYQVVIPAELGTTAQRIGALEIPGPGGAPVSWVAQVVNDVKAKYQALNAAQKEKAKRVLEPTFLIEPFVESVVNRFAGQASAAPLTFKAFRSTDDQRWSVGRLHFFDNGQPYRLEVQYSLNYGAVTSVTLDKGLSVLDEMFMGLSSKLRAPGSTPYYGLELSGVSANPLRLGGSGLQVGNVDRRLGMLEVSMPTGNTSTNTPTSLTAADFTARKLTVPGTAASDRAGYNRQLRGERWEFVPADEILLYGNETYMVFYVDQLDGKIGRIYEATFKGTIPLCPGLSIRYGDDLKSKISAWTAQVGPDTYRDCDVVFNKSANGNVLNSVASLTNKVTFTTVDGRAVAAARWR